MKKLMTLFMLAFVAPVFLFAQEEATETKKENSNKSLLGYWVAQGDKPVRNPYESGYLIDNATNVIQTAGTLEFVIQHRFGTMDNGLSDFWGIYGAANTRLGLNYSITDWLQLGIGTTKNYMVQDIGLKVNLLQQSREDKVPVSVTYFGDWSIQGKGKEEDYGMDYSFSDRFAFFNELLVTRKFTDWFTFSVGGSFTHFNQVDSLYDHDRIAMHFLGRIKVSPQTSVIVNYDLPLNIKGISEWGDHHYESAGMKRDDYLSSPNLGFGVEIATSTHAFQIFAGTSTLLVPQYNTMKNFNHASDGDFFIGFNITRLWSF